MTTDQTPEPTETAETTADRVRAALNAHGRHVSELWMTTDPVAEHLELATLRRWKAEADHVLAAWQQVADLIPADVVARNLGRAWPAIVADYLQSLQTTTADQHTRKLTREQAEAEGWTVDTHCYPWFAYKGGRFAPTATVPVVTPEA